MPSVILILILLVLAQFAEAQTISAKENTTKNSPVFTANGFFNFAAAYRNQASSFEERDAPSIGNDSQLFLKAKIATSNKAKHGIVTKFETNLNSDGRRQNPNLDQAFLFSEGNFGKFEFGNVQASNQKMKVGPTAFARGAGGINGKYLENINLASSANSAAPQFILLAQSPIGHGGYAVGTSNYSQKNNFRALKDDSFDGAEDATKLSYYTPVIQGLKIGASYAPNTGNSGLTTKKYYRNSVATIRDVLSFGANYFEDFDNLSLEISASAENGRVKKNIAGRKNLMAYDVATTLSYFGFNFGASYGSWESSLQTEEQQSQANYHTFGFGYSFGPIAASVTSLKSQFQENDYSAVSLGLDYKLTKDLMPYFELTKFSFKANKPQISDILSQGALVTNNQGYVFLTGILISF